METLISEFLTDCQIRGRTKRTLETYKGVVTEFLQYYPRPEEVGKRDLRDYLAHLQERDLAIGTLKGYFSALSTLYDYLIFEEVTNTNPIVPFRQRYIDQPTKNERRQIPSLKDVRTLLGSIDEIREIAMIVTLAKTGARLGEYIGLQIDDIDFHRSVLKLPEEEKRHNQFIPMDDELQGTLEVYMEWRNRKARSKWLWISNHGKRIHKDYTNAVLAYYAKPLNLHEPGGPLERRLTAHCFRGFFTTQLRKAGMIEEYLQVLRGDSLQKQTWKNHYLSDEYLGFEEIRKEYLRCMPELL